MYPFTHTMYCGPIVQVWMGPQYVYRIRMMRFAMMLLVAWVAHGEILKAQNLVPNPDFSLVTDCPGRVSEPPCPNQFDCIVDWYAVTPQVPPWELHVCGTDERGLPYHGFTYQEPKKGEGIIRISAIGTDCYSRRTMAGCALLDTMLAGVEYYVSFYVNRRENYDGIRTYYDAIGASFSDTMVVFQVDCMTPQSVPPPAIWARDVIRDTVGWEKVSGCYTARGGERHMLIGSMKPFDQLKTEIGDSIGSVLVYYIDDVGVYAFNPLPDTLWLCPGDTATLQATFPDADIFWTGGTQDSVYTVTAPGVVHVEARLEECTLRDEVVVIYLPPPGEQQETVKACAEEESVMLTFPYPGVPVWEDGTVASEWEVSEAGLYQAYLINTCGQYVARYDVDFQPCVCPMYLPTGFSPNNDGINDRFLPLSGCDLEIVDMRFEVYDRWGNLLHTEQGEELSGWDGTSRNSILDAGLYVWTLSYTIRTYSQEERTFRHSGEVQLMR